MGGTGGLGFKGAYKDTMKGALGFRVYREGLLRVRYGGTIRTLIIGIGFGGLFTKKLQ